MVASPLDLDAVQAFVLIADCGSFTRASELMDTSQAAISLKLKRLEKRLDCRLLERTPRHVRLSAQGSAFIAEARKLLAAHEQAMASVAGKAVRRITLGISDHVADSMLPTLLSQLAAHDPLRVVEVRVSDSRDLKALFERGALDAVIIRQEIGDEDGELLVEDLLGWFAAPSWRRCVTEPLRVAMLAEPCGIRAIAIRVLDAMNIPWTEVFVGGRVKTVGTAVSAGTAVAAMARRIAPADLVEVGQQFGLPLLPTSKIVLLTHLRDAGFKKALRGVASAFSSACTSAGAR